MTKEYITFKEYSYLCNRIAYWLVSNKVKFNKRNVYGYFGREADQGTIENAILERGTNYQTDALMNEYVECAVHDNNDLSFLPNYVTGSDGEKYYKNTYVDMVRRVSEYEVKNKDSPAIVYTKTTNTSTNNCTNPYTQSPVLTNTGANGMGQLTGYSCGCNALQQAFYNLTGKIIDESTIMKWAGTTTSGTSHQGLNTAVAQFNKQYGYNIKIQWKNLSDYGSNTTEQFKNIAKLKCEGKFIFYHLLYRNQYGHYETYQTYNTNSNLFTILNSLGSKGNNGYYGYKEQRTATTQKQYISGISQPSVCILWR